MIAKVSKRTRTGRSSFRRLAQYMTTERDPETGIASLRGDVLLSNNLLDFETAAYVMQATAEKNRRCDDPVCHYELCWPPGEMPTREQWTICALYTLRKLGYQDHQYMVVAHDDRAHFHIHIMVNKVHPETYRAPTPFRNWFTLDAAARALEAKYGWAHTAGPIRWDEESKQAVRTSRSERNALRAARQHPTGAAAKVEHYHDEESLQSYVRQEVAPSVRQLLVRRKVTWDDLHILLSKAHLRLEKGKTGGYTVLAIDHNIHVKASDVFRDNFAGKINRQVTEAALGTWSPASAFLQESVPGPLQQRKRNTILREERKAERRQDRDALMDEYNRYRNQRREVCKAFTRDGKEGRQYHLDVLREHKREIRASALPWQDKKVLLSQAAAQSVLEVRAFKLSIQQRRQEASPKDLRSWVADRAAGGDARAAAQLRGWRYADQRNQRQLNGGLEASALHMGPPEDNEKSDWADFAQQRLSAQRREQNLAAQIATTRIWTINRKTGDVSYMLNGRVPILMLTVQESEESKVEALDAGADDYITKPFQLRELTARLRAATRRNQPEDKEGTPIAIGDVLLDPTRHLVEKSGRAVHLTPKQFDLLHFLMLNAGRPVSHSKLLRSVWGPEYGNELEYLRTFIRQIRIKIENDPAKPEYLLTESHIGYRFSESV